MTGPIGEAVRLSLAQIPDGKRGALLVVADEDGVHAMVAAQINGHWKLAVDASKPWQGPVTGLVSIEGTW